MDGFQLVNPIVVAPTYNNAKTLPVVLARLEALGLPVLVVNDGCTDDTALILARWNSENPAQHHVLTHETNRGKAAALRTGFESCIGKFSHAISIDTDGQLDPADIPRLLARARRRPEALIVGTRDATREDYPPASRWGRKISNFLVRVESGERVSDSQCGLRVYPIQLMQTVHCKAERYGFETEIITRAGWLGTPVLGEPVSCIYLPIGQRVSHFRPAIDSLRAVGMHARLMLAAVWPLPRKVVNPAGVTIHRRSILRRFIHWINPITAWRQVRGEVGGRAKFSAGFALGVFVANLPIYGLQTVCGLFIAKRLKLHPLSVVAGVNMSFPPVGPLLIAMAVTVGHFMLYGRVPTLANYDVRHVPLASMIGPFLLEWSLGAVIVGIFTGAIAFVLLDVLLRASVSTTGWIASKNAEPVE